MANTKKVFEAVLAGRGSINFHDFERLLSALGFRLTRTSGSHRISFTRWSAGRFLCSPMVRRQSGIKFGSFAI
jgi:phosphohistidine phosphatase SixA